MFINVLTSMNNDDREDTMTMITRAQDQAGAVRGPPSPLHLAARASLASVALTAVTISVNHLQALGSGALLLGLLLLVLPAALLLWFRRARSRVALAGYLLVSAWMVVGFGFYQGLWKGALRLFLGTLLPALSSSFPRPAVGNVVFEMSGLGMLVGSSFVLYHGVRLLLADRAARTGSPPAAPSPRQRVVLAAGALLGLGVLGGAYARSVQDRWTPPPDGVVKIGVIVPRTGPYKILGDSFVKAVEMARDDLKSTRYRYQLVVRDSGPDPARARAVIEEVIRDEKVAAVVGGISLIGQVIKPHAARARIPQMCVCTVSSIGDGAYSFTNIVSPEAEAARWVEEAQRRGIRTLALLTQDYPSIKNHVKALKVAAARAGLRIIYERTFGDAVTDFRGLVAEAAAVGPDVHYVEALNPGLDRLGRQLADAGVHNLASVVAPSVSETPQVFEGTWYTDSNLLDPGFRRRFEEKYPGTQFATHMMPYAYDSLNMIVQAFERGQNPAAYLRAMRTYDGTADRLTKEPGSGNFQSAPAVWVIKGGKPTLENSP
jgi:ABC-type branched-subunit amino acid transport system substrate-binding protein